DAAECGGAKRAGAVSPGGAKLSADCRGADDADRHRANASASGAQTAAGRDCGAAAAPEDDGRRPTGTRRAERGDRRAPGRVEEWGRLGEAQLGDQECFMPEPVMNFGDPSQRGEGNASREAVEEALDRRI